uniref:Ubiquitin-like domain-containing protein n=1 Tax=Strigamia maritima TaxID=126957 RepID=T1IW83_STRMM
MQRQQHQLKKKLKLKVLVKGRTKLVCLLAAKNTLKDLKKQIKDDKCIDNLDKAIFQQKDEDDELVDLCDSHQLGSGDKVHVTYETE